jgi:hypothetical protein
MPSKPRSKSPRPAAAPLPATFVDDDGRYAVVGGKVYAVLLSSCKADDLYEEDWGDTKEFPKDWCAAFVSVLQKSQRAVLVSNANADGQYRPLGLFRIENPRMTNFLTCRIGTRARRLKFGV